MKTLIVCYSAHHDNTLMIAREISTVLEADLKAPEEVDPHTVLDEYDLFGFGSGIYAGRHAPQLCACVESFRQTVKPAFIFSTHALSKLFFYHTFLRRKLSQKGFLILPDFSCQGYSCYGPLKFVGGMNKGKPDEEDRTRARAYAKTLKAYFELGTISKG